jgi:uncharacterized C2H2 Zn-finger protein
MSLFTCPHCKANVRADRIATHILKVHATPKAAAAQQPILAKSNLKVVADAAPKVRLYREVVKDGRVFDVAVDPNLPSFQGRLSDLSAQARAGSLTRCPRCDSFVREDRLAKHVAKFHKNSGKSSNRQPQRPRRRGYGPPCSGVGSAGRPAARAPECPRRCRFPCAGSWNDLCAKCQHRLIPTYHDGPYRPCEP